MGAHTEDALQFLSGGDQVNYRHLTLHECPVPGEVSSAAVVKHLVGQWGDRVANMPPYLNREDLICASDACHAELPSTR